MLEHEGLEQLRRQQTFSTPLTTQDAWEELERLDVAGWIEICLKSQLVERNVELQELGQAAQGSVKGKVFEYMLSLVKSLAWGQH